MLGMLNALVGGSPKRELSATEVAEGRRRDKEAMLDTLFGDAKPYVKKLGPYVSTPNGNRVVGFSAMMAGTVLLMKVTK